MGKQKSAKSASRTHRDSRLTDHHRRPTSIGGSNANANRADVPHDIHSTWHTIVANMCAPEHVKLINTFLRDQGVKITAIRKPEPLHNFLCPRSGKCCIFWYKKRKHLPRHERKQRTPKSWRRMRRREAWQELRALIAHETGNPSLETAITYINDFLTDSDYVLKLETL